MGKLKMEKQQIEELYQTSRLNRDTLDDECCCIWCNEYFNKSKIIEWCHEGQTAICPECDTDSVISKIDKESLNEMRKYYFE